jgi:hypothetical protein
MSSARRELRRLIESACIALVGAVLCWALEGVAASHDVVQTLVDRGGGAGIPWAAFCAVAALGLRVWLILVAPGVLLYRAAMLALTLAAERLAGRAPSA